MVYMFTAEERILVHLLDYVKFEDSYEVPVAVTQYGIGNDIGAGQDYVSRALKRLRSKNMVSEKRTRVEGMRTRRKVYFLTSAGIHEAQEIRARLLETDVTVVLSDASEKRMRVSEVLKDVQTDMGLLDVIKYTTKDGVLNLVEVKGRRSVDDLVDFSEKAPSLKYFFGRTEELARIKVWLKSHKIIVIHGMAGIGKTALVSKMVEQFKKEKSILWYKFHEWDTIKNPLMPLADVLAHHNKRRLKNYLASKANIDITEIGYLLEEEFRDVNLLMVFDDFHKASVQVSQLFSILVEILERVKGVQMIMTTRYPVLFYDRREVMIKRIVAEMHLKGLDEESANRLLAERRIDRTLFHQAYELTEGHPLMLELIEPEGIKMGKDININKYIDEEIFSKLSNEEKTLMLIASVYRYPVQPRALFIKDDMDYDVLVKLKNRFLIQEYTLESYGLHDFIREFFYARLTPKQRMEYHSAAAKYYKDMEGHRAVFEALFHSVKAREFVEAANLATASGLDLISKGYLEEFLDIIKDIKMDEIEKERSADLHLIMARISDIIGEWDQSLEYFKLSLGLIDDEQSKIEPYWNIGWILQKRNNWEGAMENFEKCLTISKKAKDAAGMADALHGMGRVAWRQGDWKKAKDYCEKAVSYGREAADPEVMASALIELGRVFAEMGDLKQGEVLFMECLEVLKQIENPFETSRAYNSLGWEVYRPMEDWDKALDCYMKSMLIARDIGYTEGLGPVCHSLGDSYTHLKDFKKAHVYLAESLSVFKKLGDVHGEAYNYLSFGILNKYQGNWDEAEDYFQMAINMFEDVKTPYDMAYAKYEYGLMKAARGDSKLAKKNLTEALETFKVLGADGYVSKAKVKLGELKK